MKKINKPGFCPSFWPIPDDREDETIRVILVGRTLGVSPDSPQGRDSLRPVGIGMQDFVGGVISQKFVLLTEIHDDHGNEVNRAIQVASTQKINSVVSRGKNDLGPVSILL